MLVWGQRYDQRAWIRQLDRPVTREMEDAVLRTIARLDGGRRRADLETAYCAEVLATTFQALGRLSGKRWPNWYDGRFLERR